MISDLRESGAIEQDADMIWFVYRPFKYKDRAEMGEVSETYAELIVATPEWSPEDIKMTFIGKHAAFTTTPQSKTIILTKMEVAFEPTAPRAFASICPLESLWNLCLEAFFLEW